jgi:carbonic anhydrase
MMHPIRGTAACLFVGLVFALSATAEEHKSPDTPSPAAKAAAAALKAKLDAEAEAKAKPGTVGGTKLAAAKTTTLDTGGIATEEGAKSATAKASVKPAPPALIYEPRLSILPVHPQQPQSHARPKPHKPAPVHVALANTSAAPTKSDAHAAATPNAPAPGHSLHWSYEGATGPQAWAKLSPEYAKCGSGERQSPIDIRDGMKLDLDPIVFEYRPSSYKVVDNGHTIQANVGGWNSMRVMGRRFKLVQFHFHSPSEEAIDGKQFEMVVHLVHKDSEGRLAVVAVLVDKGARQPAIQAVLNNIPLEQGEEVAAATNLDLNQMLPDGRRYYTYMGSLTTPPCTEDVLWVVMKQPVYASAEQLNLFTRMYPMNARPIQASSGRMIKESN